MIANGMTNVEILRDFPYLEADDLRAAVAFAAAQMGGTVVVAA
jgi:uncharacterized protein (DUF433 family)